MHTDNFLYNPDKKLSCEGKYSYYNIKVIKDLLKVIDDASHPLEIAQTWEEREMHTDNFFDNPGIKLNCEGKIFIYL